MVDFVQIEKLKQQMTDKYVVVQGNRPELARFQNQTGQVKTVNMSGRALVEFEAYNNIGWYDIDPDFLKVVDQPQPKPAEKAEKKEAAPKAKAPEKPAAASGEKKLSPLEMARQQGAAKKEGEPKAVAGGGKSTSDILAAARAAKSGSPAPTAEKNAPAEKKASTADILAAARAKNAPAAAPEAKAAPAAAPGGKMSTADILAAARAKKAAEAAAPAVAAPVVEKPAPAAPEEPVIVAPAAAPVAEKPAAEKSAKSAGGALPKETAEIIAWCRKADAK